MFSNNRNDNIGGLNLLSMQSSVTHASLLDKSYFDSRIVCLAELYRAMCAEVIAYQSIEIKLDKLKKKKLRKNEQPLLAEALDIQHEWKEKGYPILISLALNISIYLNQRLQEQLEKFVGLPDDCEETKGKIASLTQEFAALAGGDDLPPVEDENALNLTDLIKNAAFTQQKRINKLAELQRIREFVNDFPRQAQVNFEGYTYTGTKNGGANFAGELGGWYQHNRKPLRSLFKKETAVEKVIGEFLAGNLLHSIYENLHVPEERYAKVSLARPANSDPRDKSGEDVYLRSDGIPGYQQDLWAYAWQDDELPSTRPPGLFHQQSLDWTDHFILSNHLKEEFAKLAVPRLLLADFGVHNGNFGVTHDQRNNVHLVALDYGAAFSNLSPIVNPYLPPNSWIEFYKNHFLDYDMEINASEEMANVFIRIGNMETPQIHSALHDALYEVCKLYHTSALVKFSQRLDIPEISVAMDSKEIKQKISSFIKEVINQRKLSLKIQGYGLLLEHCVEVNANNEIEVNADKLRSLLKRHGDGLKNFIHSEDFTHYTLVRHKALTGIAKLAQKLDLTGIVNYFVKNYRDDPLKEAIREAAQKPSHGTNSDPIHKKKLSFLGQHMGTILTVMMTWSVAGASIGGALSLTATVGLSAPLLVLLGAILGGVLGLTIGIVACLVKDCVTPTLATSSTHYVVDSRLRETSEPTKTIAPTLEKGIQETILDEKEKSQVVPSLGLHTAGFHSAPPLQQPSLPPPNTDSPRNDIL